MPQLFHLFIVAFVVSSFVYARVWNDTGNGTIVFEEAWTIPELTTATDFSYVSCQMVLSCASPCIQGISDPTVANAMAINVNNQLAAQISNNTLRFGAFAALSMHNASEAAAELKRTVQELGFLGGLVNDYQQSGENNGEHSILPDTLIYYDQPDFDIFWQMVTELDVPVYFHPRTNVEPISTLLYGHAPWLLGPGQEFAVTLSNHILGLCTNGVFDRFPDLKIIVGHLGERIPSDLVRIDTQLLRQVPLGMPMLRNVSTYFHTNLYETTSGNFATTLLQFHIQEIGLDRILFSIDYPFVDIPSGATWVNGLDEVLTPEELLSLKRGAAIQLLKLND
ncbi:amidohydrolase 2 [Lentinula lateritia]|uniref:Amidohydrolase 2 n=1 Tax=Lentinula aff. lateritia TaxID=2804960 RepID=A0ACC1U9J0_9AGAR|nr:amidohydrolase 2 [Lentinula aff. lateritia]KAJ3854510.1 amidohydrolase 2 [Lentinula lateritia]